MDTCVQVLRDYTVQWCADISRPASLSLFIPPSFPISRYIFTMEGTASWKGWKSVKIRPKDEVIQTKVNEPCRFCLYRFHTTTTTAAAAAAHTLSTHFPTTKIHLVLSIDSKWLFSRVGRGAKEARYYLVRSVIVTSTSNSNGLTHPSLGFNLVRIDRATGIKTIEETR